jgi:hypothetical protein
LRQFRRASTAVTRSSGRAYGASVYCTIILPEIKLAAKTSHLGPCAGIQKLAGMGSGRIAAQIIDEAIVF